MSTTTMEHPAPTTQHKDSSDPKPSSNDYSNQETQSLTYSHVTQKTNFPNKEQAIILDSIEEISIKEYIFAVGNIVNPRNIRFASRISNNRVCLYLADSSIVRTIVRNKTKVNIKGHDLFIRPLISEARRVLLSNVCPVIPHDVILKKLTDIGVNCTSAISFIKAGISEPGFSHILSFRRQVYISPEDCDKLPDSIQILHDETTYWIYLTTDNPVCFFCKKEGHIAKKCPNLKIPDARSTTTTCDVVIDQDHSKAPNMYNQDFPALPNSSMGKTPTKRPLADSSSTASHSTSHDLSIKKAQVLPLQTSNFVNATTPGELPSISTPKDTPNHSKKKAKKDDENLNGHSLTDKIDTILSPAKSILLNQPEDFILSYVDLKEFLDHSDITKDTISIASKYTTDFKALVHMLKKVYPLLKDKSTKNRITRINKKLELHTEWHSVPNNPPEGSTAHQKCDSDDTSPHPEDPDEDVSMPISVFSQSPDDVIPSKPV